MLRSFAIFAAGAIIGASAWSVLPTLLDNTKPYAGQETRQISSLSAKDIAQLEKGEGWGLAKPAELNGYPGPAHVLEFADQLDLTTAQKSAIQQSFTSMNTRAAQLGVALIAAEAALDSAFKEGNANGSILEERLQQTERVRAALRQVHLLAHLEVTPLLNEQQKKRYAELRGYNGGHNAHSGH